MQTLLRSRIALGLRGKIALLYLATVLSIVGAMLFLLIESLTEALNDAYRDKGLAIVRTFDAQQGSLEEIRDSKVTQARIDNLMALNPNIAKISLYVPVGDKVVRTASSDRAEIGELADDYDAEPISTDATAFHDTSKDGEGMVEILAPLHVNGHPVASIGVYLRLAPRDAVIQSQATRFAAIGLITVAVLLVALYLSLNWLLLKPLSLFQSSTRAIERGLLGTRIKLPRNDELGHLAAAFNGMADSLEKRAEENEHLQGQLRARYHQAQEQAITDPVTGLFNHRYFQDSLNNELERARRFGSSLTMLFCDIDHFKVLNDSHGHQFGDQVLRAMANLLKSAVREIDVVARYGGEEFAIILLGTDRSSGLYVGERIRELIASHQFGESPLPQEAITISIGVAAYPEDAQWREDLIWKADHAMYYAKRLGRNQVRLHSELIELEGSDLRRADRDGVGEDACLALVQSLAAAVDARDRYGRSHSEGVARCAIAIARAMGFEGRQLRNIGVAGLLHDVGKIGVPDAILSKPGRLTEEEWQKMREHPSIGEVIVRQVPLLSLIVPLIGSHHENFDGSGYPRGLRGDNIPLGARIIAVADAYHSMTSTRPYRQALSHGEAIAELRRSAGTQFDPAVVEASIAALERTDADDGADPSAEVLLSLTSFPEENPR